MIAVGIYQHRPLAWTPRSAQLVIEQLSGIKEGWSLFVGPNDGSNCHWSMEWMMSRILEQADENTVGILLDADVVYMEPGLLLDLVEFARGTDDVGFVGTKSFDPDAEQPHDELLEFVPVRWIPGYCMAYRPRILDDKHVWPDVRIPYAKGMTDVDLCAQAVQAGLQNYHLAASWIGHPVKVIPSQAHAECLAQRAYMRKKWLGQPTTTAATKEVLRAIGIE